MPVTPDNHMLFQVTGASSDPNRVPSHRRLVAMLPGGPPGLTVTMGAVGRQLLARGAKRNGSADNGATLVRWRQARARNQMYGSFHAHYHLLTRPRIASAPRAKRTGPTMRSVKRITSPQSPRTVEICGLVRLRDSTDPDAYSRDPR